MQSRVLCTEFIEVFIYEEIAKYHGQLLELERLRGCSPPQEVFAVLPGASYSHFCSNHRLLLSYSQTQEMPRCPSKGKIFFIG
jgi:hypothetical protein